MSILANKDTYVVIQGGVAGVNAARRMALATAAIQRWVGESKVGRRARVTAPGG